MTPAHQVPRVMRCGAANTTARARWRVRVDGRVFYIAASQHVIDETIASAAVAAAAIGEGRGSVGGGWNGGSVCVQWGGSACAYACCCVAAG